jgi:hypothetical protein
MGVVFGAVQTLWTKPRRDRLGPVVDGLDGLGQLGHVEG